MKSTPTYLLFSLMLAFLLVNELQGQKVARAKNLDISIEKNQAAISFDIQHKDPLATHVVDLQFLDESYQLLTPKLVSGDVGSGITTGKGKTITWAITNDIDLLGSEITPVIFVNGKSKQFNKTGGPSNAIFSFLLPGLGDYFVADPSLMTFKPYMRTLSSLGLIGLGFYLGEQRYQAEGEYRTVLKADYWRYSGSERYWERYFEGDTQYAWFEGDMEVFISLGAAIWAADIIWVLARGSNNRKFTRALSQGTSFQLGYVPGGGALQIRHTF